MIRNFLADILFTLFLWVEDNAAKFMLMLSTGVISHLYIVVTGTLSPDSILALAFGIGFTWGAFIGGPVWYHLRR